MPKAENLEQVVIFARVVDAGSFTAASKALDLPKSTVSRKVAELEAGLGARLLQRTTRKLRLTDVGRLYYGYAARIVAELDEAAQAVGALQTAPRGLLRVTTPLNFAFLAPIFTDYARKFPEVVLEVFSTDRVVALIDESFDVAIRAGHLVDSTLVARTLGNIQRIVVASPRYLKPHGRPRCPEELGKHDALVFHAGASPTTWRLTTANKTLDIAVKPRLLVNDSDMLLEAARAGLGVAMLPIFVGLPEVRAHRLEHVLPEWCSPPIPIHAVYASTRHLSPKVKSFLDHLREKLTPPPWELGPGIG